VVQESVTGPLGTPVAARWGHCSGVAVVEMALSSGLALVPPPRRNPLHTTTHGTGELLLRAYGRGFRRLVLGVGGSATNDAGLGALHALGLEVALDDGTRPHYVTGGMLGRIASVRVPEAGLLHGATVEVSCDVDTPLVGPTGATASFAQQKGANAADRALLEAGMLHASAMFPHDVRTMAGAGAAGGLPGGLRGFLGDRVVLRRGFDIVAEAHRLDQRVAAADLVVTGEGALDATTDAGKVVSRVLELCAAQNKPCVVLCGQHRGHSGSGTAVAATVRRGVAVTVHDLLSMFSLETAMAHPFDCLLALVKATARTWPVLSHLVSDL
jgi:glycerate kinase